MTRETGYEAARLGCRRVMVVTDPRLAELPPVEIVMASLDGAGVEAVLFDRVRVEPTDRSFADAIAFAQAGAFEATSPLAAAPDRHRQGREPYATYPADFQACERAARPRRAGSRSAGCSSRCR
jgi:hydroxyacid-oxoacid transhydrogenase